MTAPSTTRRLVPLVVTLIGVTLLLSLGTWQLQRRTWKHEVVDNLQARLTAAPVPLPATIGDPADWNFHPVTVTGHFLPGHDMLLSGRPRQGRAGYELATPLLRDDGGPAVLVNRGFVPLDWRDPANRRLPTLDGTVTIITGIARLPQPRLFMQPDNTPGSDAWVWVDLPAMAAAAGLPALAPLVVEAAPVPGLPPTYPEANSTRIDLPDNHLLYAITWYGLAAALAAIYFIAQHLTRYLAKYPAQADEQEED
jgi:surfeit locus 1 family protein